MHAFFMMANESSRCILVLENMATWQLALLDSEAIWQRGFEVYLRQLGWSCLIKEEFSHLLKECLIYEMATRPAGFLHNYHFGQGGPQDRVASEYTLLQLCLSPLSLSRHGHGNKHTGTGLFGIPRMEALHARSLCRKKDML